MYLTAVSLVLYGAFGLANTQRLPCCFPKQWQSFQKATEVFQTPDSQTTRLGQRLVWMDYVNQREAVTHFYDDNTSFQSIMFYNNKTRYDISEKKCTVSKLTVSMIPQCIPASNASLLEEGYVGGEKNQIHYDQWRYFLPDYNADVRTMISDSCVPLSQLVTSMTENNNYIRMTVFTDFYSTIKTPDVFVPPPECQ